MSAFVGATAVADLVKSTLGPKGMDKILQSMDPEGLRPNKVTITNDGATILKNIFVENPAAKILVDMSLTQDKEIGDGTTSVVVLAGELLREAELLIKQKVHPQTIIRGWRKALKCARETLYANSLDISSLKPEQFREELIKIAQTTLSSKIVSRSKGFFAEMAVDAVLRLKGSTNLESIQILQKNGKSLRDSYLAEGFILDKSIGVGQPKRLVNPRILVANTHMDTDKIKMMGAKVQVHGMDKIAEIEKAERKKMKKKVKKILKHDINCFINRQLIYNYPERLFSDSGIMAIEHADFEGVERLALALGAEIVSTFDHPEQVKIGRCDLIEEIMIGEDKLIKFSGCSQGESCTIVLRGGSKHILEEAERSLHDALCVLTQTCRQENRRVCFGGGCSELLMAEAVDRLAKSYGGKESIAIEAFARALRQIPIILADNAGYDSQDLVSELRAMHHKDKYFEQKFDAEKPMWGLNLNTGCVGDTRKLKISEAFRSKEQSLISSHEAAEMIIRVNNIITCAPRQRNRM